MTFDTAELDDPMNPHAKYWAGNKDYFKRNVEPERQAFEARKAMWTRICCAFFNDPPKSALEVGAGGGQNLRAIKQVYGHIDQFFAVEPNKDMLPALLRSATVMNGLATDLSVFGNGRVDLVFTSGVLIHIPPADLLRACLEINRVAAKYIVAIEYFSDEPEMKLYRGEKDLLWKRDFGKFYLDNFPKLKCISHGFEWKVVTGLDNLTWWVFKK